MPLIISQDEVLRSVKCTSYLLYTVSARANARTHRVHHSGPPTLEPPRTLQKVKKRLKQILDSVVCALVYGLGEIHSFLVYEQERVCASGTELGKAHSFLSKGGGPKVVAACRGAWLPCLVCYHKHVRAAEQGRRARRRGKGVGARGEEGEEGGGGRGGGSGEGGPAPHLAQFPFRKLNLPPNSSSRIKPTPTPAQIIGPRGRMGARQCRGAPQQAVVLPVRHGVPAGRSAPPVPSLQAGLLLEMLPGVHPRFPPQKGAGLAGLPILLQWYESLSETCVFCGAAIMYICLRRTRFPAVVRGTAWVLVVRIRRSLRSQALW